ncbi:polysaccharide lyase 6 family protein [Pedobacter arcticus]|uniref:polysaccharide lyase 6 family protein n=1 Tax=Pedobacter arcticus TaxID=752140 RepID=UPI0006849D39|nr:polysaccharide lyase 6 family protein [Pedobacter arcticus]
MKVLLRFLVFCFILPIAISGCKKSKQVEKEPPIVVPPVEEPACKSCKLISSAAELAALTLIPGDTIMMKSGDWTDQKLVFKAKGTAQLPIVLIAQKAGSVNMKGASSIQIDGEYLEVSGLNFRGGKLTVGQFIIDFTSSSSNCRLTNTAIVDYNPTDATIDYRWVSMNGTKNRLDHCYIKGKSHQGATVVVWGKNSSLGHRIDHNYFGTRPDLGNNGGETIRVGTSDYYLTQSNVTVEDNIFDKCNGETEIVSNKMSNNIIRNNLFFESRGTLSLRHGNGTEVYGNYIIGNNLATVGGIRIIGENHLVYNNYIQGLKETGQLCAISIMDGVPNSAPSGYFQVKNVKVVGNTIVNCAEAFEIGAGKGGNDRTVPPANCTIANNLVQQKGGATLLKLADTPTGFTYTGNMAYATGVTMPEGFVQITQQMGTTTFGTYAPQSGHPAFGAFQGTFPFYTSTDVGAKALGDTHNALLKGEGIGPTWVPGLAASIVIKAQ